MLFLKNCRRFAGPVLALALSTSPTLAAQIQAIAPSHPIRVQRQIFGPTPNSSAPQGAKLTYQDSTNLSAFSSCNANQAWPWTAAFSPDGAHIYVPLFGGFTGQGGCTLLKLDASTLQHLATIQLEESPEEVVFTTDPNGSVVLGFATNSAASSVTVFNAADQVLSHVPIPILPGNVYGTAFPFGMAVSPDQSTVWVGTSEGRIYALDVASRSLDLTRTIDLGPNTGFARFAFMGNLLVLPATIYHTNFQGSTAKLIVLDPAQPGSAQEVILDSSPSTAAFPSPQDLAIRNGKIYVAGFDMGPHVFVIDGQSLSIDALLATGTGHPQGKFQALTMTPSGTLLVADFTTAQIARIDSYSGHLLGLVPCQTYGYGPQELSVSPDGQTLVVPLASDSLLRFNLH